MNIYIEKRVHYYFCEKDLNCASAALHIVLEYFDIAIEKQVLDSAVGMHGAGGYRAQCGIVEGVLMSIGIVCRNRNIADDETVLLCRGFAQKFENEFNSLSCEVLRPNGFNDNDPPHLCEGLTVDGIRFGIVFIAEWLEKIPDEISL
ncbi:MAG: redox-active protein [Desulfotalea sp.]|nr:MAG: redox-active protein [Desulfotalea sp.]